MRKGVREGRRTMEERNCLGDGDQQNAVEETRSTHPIVGTFQKSQSQKNW